MRASRVSAWLLLALAGLASVSAVASDTTTFTYDELGRLIQTSHSGTVNNGLSATYGYDPAGNRSNVAVVLGAPVTPSFSIDDVAATEGGNLVLTVTKTGTTSSSLSVNFATANGTATAGADYTAASNTLIFAAVDTTKTITITTTDDVAVEGSETVLVNLSGATGGATISDTQGVGTINDNDSAPPSFAVSNASAVTEGGTLVYTVTKTGTTGLSFSVNYATANGTATAGSDYTAASGTLTFLAADTTKTVSVATTDDASSESAETVLLNLSGATGGATITTSQASGTINDNDPTNQPPVANADSASVQACLTVTKNVIANDTDPENNTPLTLTNVSGGTLGSASVLNSTTVQYDAGGVPGSDPLTYTVSDSLGATSNGTLTVTVTSAQCNAPNPGGE